MLAVTRELKLALIVGFSLVLVITVLISDHLSRARKATLDGTVAQQPQQTPKPVTPPTSFAQDIREPESKLAGGPLGNEPIRTEPRVPDYQGIASNDSPQSPQSPQDPAGTTVELKQGSSADTDLATLIQNMGGEIRDGRIYLPPAAQPDLSKPRSEPSGETPGGGATNSPERLGTSESEPSQKPGLVPQPDRPSTPSGREYQIAPGDSLYKIAKREYGDGELWRKLAQHNIGRVGPTGEVRVGAKIILPARSDLASGGNRAEASPRRADGVSKKLEQSKIPPVLGRPEPLPSSAKTRVYTIKKGDTLGSIAMRELGTTKRANEILELNKNVIRNPNAVPLGVTIKLPA